MRTPMIGIVIIGRIMYAIGRIASRRRVAFSCVGFCWVALRAPLISAQTVGMSPPSELHRQPVSDTAVQNIALNSRMLIEHDFLHDPGLSVRVISIAGESGSAGGESDATIDWLYVGVSGFGEAPPQRVYRLGPVYSPKIDALVIESRVPVLYISYGAPDRRQHARIVVTLDHLSVGLAPTVPRISK
jgi:hypothetical protein